jgi:RND family efflux transporter MFP subunit
MKSRARILVPLVILVLGFAAMRVLVAFRPSAEPQTPQAVAPLVRVVVARPSDVEVRVRTQGTVVPRTESDLIPQVAGEVVWVSPSLVSGGFFEKGEALVRLDRGDYAVELRSAEASVARAESEFQRAATELERQRRLKERGVTSQTRIDDAENAYAVAEATLREARARRERARRDLSRTELRAPFQGRVRAEDVDAGQFVNRGTPIATLYAVDVAEVRMPLPDRELRWLDLPLGYAAPVEDGPEVILRAEFAGEPQEWRGRVVRTEGEIDARSRMIHVVAQVDDPYGHDDPEARRVPLAVGLFVEGEIEGRTLHGAFELPRAALHADRAGEGDRVHVVDAEGRLRVRPVEVLHIERETVVIGEGLAPGDRVSISALEAVVDGMPVRIADDARPDGAAPEVTIPAAASEPDPRSSS